MTIINIVPCMKLADTNGFCDMLFNYYTTIFLCRKYTFILFCCYCYITIYSMGMICSCIYLYLYIINRFYVMKLMYVLYNV